jgi:hypothetical protein
MGYVTDTGEDFALTMRSRAHATYESTLSDSGRTTRIIDLENRNSALVELVYGTTENKDDEILNWTFPDVSDDINAAIWNLSSGFYKSAAANLRNALELGVVALYFQVRDDAGKNDFGKWDRGESETPNWGTTKPCLKMQVSIQRFSSATRADIVEEAHGFFKFLCNFTHGRPFDQLGGEPTNSFNLAGGGVPALVPQAFTRIADLTEETTVWIATLWLAAYPDILRGRNFNQRFPTGGASLLLNKPRGLDVVRWAASLAPTLRS